MFGNDTPTLQRLAIKLLSQCASSSGCERNWSTFTFIHTKLRNRLGHKKLHQLVFVNYNLRLRIQRAGSKVEPSDFDPVSGMMDLSFYRQQSAIQDWMEHSRSNAPPTLDEDSDISDVPLPNPMFTSLAEDNENLEQWAGENVGDTHLGKRKTKVLRPQRPEKKGKMIRSPPEEELASNETTPDPSGGGDEGNTDDDDDDDDDNDDGGSGYPVSSQAGGRSDRSMSPIRFTGETDFTHATQDQDHGQPMSQRRTTSNRRRYDPREGDSSSSVSSTFRDPRPPSYPYPYPQPYPYPYPQPYSHPPPYPSHFIQLPVHLGMSTSGQIGELQVCMYIYYNFIIMCSPLI
jgi:hypothetical protein